MRLLLRPVLLASLVFGGLTFASAPAAACGPETGLECVDGLVIDPWGEQIDIAIGTGSFDPAIAVSELVAPIMSAFDALGTAINAFFEWAGQPQPPAGVFGPGYGDCDSCWDRD